MTGAKEKKLIADLYYADGDQWFEIPEWAKFFINIGNFIADYETANHLILGIAVPTGAYAAALTAFGVVASLAKKIDYDDDPTKHFQKICSLTVGTPVTYIEKNRIKKGIFKGCELMRETPRRETLFIGIQLESKAGGGLTIWLPPKESFRVKEVQAQTVMLPKRQKGRRMVRYEGFISSLLCGVNIKDFVLNTRLECTIIGNVSLLRSEIKDSIFSCRPSDSSLSGTLQDILRARQFLGENDSYRTEILKSIGKNPPQTFRGEKPYLVIFAGANGLVKWRENFRRSHWVALLDRSEPLYTDAVTTLNQDYIQNRISGAKLQSIPKIPMGIEMIAFEERLR
jgi:hypothetical protein